MKVFACDPAVKNVGVCIAEVSDAWEIERVVHCRRVDLTNLRCGRDCPLPHSAHVVDRMEHFLAQYATELDAAHVIVVEAQPFQSAGSEMACLLYARHRAKTQLVQPSTLHRFFNLKGLDYEQRKERIVEITAPFLREHEAWTSQLRQHDISDAMALIMCVSKRNADELSRQARLRENRRRPFEQFRLVMSENTERAR